MAPTRRMTVQGSTARRAIADAVAAHHQEHGYGPSLRGLAVVVGLSLATTAHHVRLLRAEGVLACEPGIPRSLRVLEMRSRDAP